jgi:hypothetical protein
MKKQLNEVKRMQRLAGIKTNLNESIEGYNNNMEEENQVEAKADRSWESLPREHAGAYLVKMDWNDDKQSFLDAIETVKSQLKKDKTKFKYGVKLSGTYKKGNPNYPDGGQVTIYGDAAEVIAFLASDDGGMMGSEKEANAHFMEFGMLRPDRFR